MLKVNIKMYFFMYVFNCLWKYLFEEIVNEVRCMNFIIDCMGVVFDVLLRSVEEFIVE